MYWIIGGVILVVIALLSIVFLFKKKEPKRKPQESKTLPSQKKPETVIATQTKSKKKNKKGSTGKRSGNKESGNEGADLTNDETNVSEETIEPTHQSLDHAESNLLDSDDGKLQALQDDNAKLQTEMKNLQTKLEEAGKIANQREEKGNKLHDSKKELEKQLTEIKNMNTKLKEELESKSKSHLILEKKLQEANKEKVEEANEKATRNEENYKKIVEAKEKLHQQVIELENTITKLQQDLDLRSKEHTGILEKNVDLESKYSSINAKKIELVQKVETLTSQLKMKDAELKSQSEKLLIMERDKTNLSSQLDSIKSQRKNDEVNQRNMYKKYEEKMEEMTAKERQMKSEAANLNRVLHENDKEIKLLKHENEEIKQLKLESDEEIKQLRHANKELSQQMNELEKENCKHTERLKECETKLKNTESTLKKLDIEHMAVLEQMEKLKKDLRDQAEVCEEKNSIVHKLGESINEKEKEVQELKQSLVSKDKEISTLISKHQSEMTNASKINETPLKGTEKTDLETELQPMILANNALNAEVNQMKAYITDLETQLNDTRNVSKEKDINVATLQDQKLCLLKTIDQLKSDISNKNEESSVNFDSIREKDIVIKELLNEKTTLMNKCELLKKESSDAINKLDISIDQEISELTSVLEDRLRDLDKLRNEKSELLSENEDLKTKMIQIKTEESQKSEKLNLIRMEYASLAEKYGYLERELDESKISKSEVVEETISGTIQTQAFQAPEISYETLETQEEKAKMQSHIEKLSTELLSLQAKYYDLKQNSIASDDHKKSEKVCYSDASVSSIETGDTDGQEMHVDKSETRNHLLASIDKLNVEITEQRLKNQTLNEQIHNKNIEVNALKQCLFGLDGGLLTIENLALDLQNSFSESSLEKTRLKSDLDELRRKYDELKIQCQKLEIELNSVKNLSSDESADDAAKPTKSQLTKYEEEIFQLKAQSEYYRQTLEKTETCLKKIQDSVDQEENSWKVCLQSSEQEQERLETKIKELLSQIEDLKNRRPSDPAAMIPVETQSLANGFPPSETKKKKKRKNKKKKNKNR